MKRRGEGESVADRGGQTGVKGGGKMPLGTQERPFKASYSHKQYKNAVLDKSLVERLSARKKEPRWMLERRLLGLETFGRLPMPGFGPDLTAGAPGLDLSQVAMYVEPEQEMVGSWAEVPEEIRETFERLGIPEAERAGLAGVGAQYDSELVYHNVRRQVEAAGVVYLPMEEAVRSRRLIEVGGLDAGCGAQRVGKSGGRKRRQTGEGGERRRRQVQEVVREYFMGVVPVDLHKFAALHAAVWSGGSFVYVPAGVTVEIPLQSYFRLNAPGAGQFEHTLIIVEEGADLHFIEGCSAPRYNVANLHAGCVELVVKRGARLKYSTVESWSKNMYNLNTKAAVVEADGKMEWVTGSFGSAVSMLYPSAMLRGEGAVCEYTGVTFAGTGQRLDTGVKVIHAAPKTYSYIDARSLAKDGGETTYRSLVEVRAGATGAKSFADCKSLMLDGRSRADTVPEVRMMESTAEVGHEASVGRLGERELAYLMARGLSEAEARGLMVRGFTEDISKELPVEYAMEMNNLIKLEMEGQA